MRISIAVLVLASCSTKAPDPTETPPPDVAAPPADAPAVSSGLGAVTDIADLAACPNGTVAGATCKHVTVAMCPGIEGEALGATIAILAAAGTPRGTVVHFSGGGGEGFESSGATSYRDAQLAQVFVSWDADWEQTQTHGIKTAACRPATVLRWIFDDLHGGSRELAFCGQGRSGGSGQLAYALAHYQLGEILDHVNLISGPPFERIDLGCDGDAPAAATVCSDTVTMRLPDKVGGWENTPDACGASGVGADIVQRWKDDSIGIGGTYVYPQTRVELFDCTNAATAVTGMAKLLFDQLAAGDPGGVRSAYHCFSEADGCHGEGLGAAGDAQAFQALIDGCQPSHR